MNAELPYGGASKPAENFHRQSQIDPVQAEYLKIGFLAGELSAKLNGFHNLLRGVTHRRFDCLGWYYDTNSDFIEMSNIYVLKNWLEEEATKHPEARGFEFQESSMGIWKTLITYHTFLSRFGAVYSQNPIFKKRADKRIREKIAHNLKDLVEEALRIL